MITGYVYNGCGKLEKGIAATRPLKVAKTCSSCRFITRNLVLALFMSRQFEEIAELVNAKIDATDMQYFNNLGVSQIQKWRKRKKQRVIGKGPQISDLN